MAQTYHFYSDSEAILSGSASVLSYDSILDLTGTSSFAVALELVLHLWNHWKLRRDPLLASLDNTAQTGNALNNLYFTVWTALLMKSIALHSNSHDMFWMHFQSS